MTCEDIIQRLLDERHITVKEAMVMIKALVKNLKDVVPEEEPKKEVCPQIEISQPKPFWDGPQVVCCYGVQIPNYSIGITSKEAPAVEISDTISATSAVIKGLGLNETK